MQNLVLFSRDHEEITREEAYSIPEFLNFVGKTKIGRELELCRADDFCDAKFVVRELIGGQYHFHYVRYAK